MDKQQRKEYDRQYYLAHKERICARIRQYEADHPELQKERQKRWRDDNPEVSRAIHRKHYYRYRERLLADRRAYRRANLDYVNALGRKNAYNSRTRIKNEVLTYYGGGKCECVTCGENRIACLSIDHINNDGMAHRKTLSFCGSQFYSYLKTSNYPEGYQTLCMNCQFIKKAENQRRRREEYGGA